MKSNFSKKLSVSFFLIFFLISWASAKEESIDEFLAQVEKYLALRDIPSYLDTFSPEIRDKEKEIVTNIFNQFQIESVTFFRANRGTQGKDEAKIYLQVLFQNSYFVMIETWHLTLLKEEGRWQIKKKRFTGNVRDLYKVEIPSERVEKVKSVEINHVDIKLSFKDALLFYDNIPRLETALLIVGKGELYFSPSEPKEKHQLELIYKNKFLRKRLKYAYLRFSNFFFNNNIKIIKESDKKNFQVSEKVRKRAYSLFFKHYSRSFTIENSLSGELLSFLPQGQEVVFEFESNKIGKLTYIYSPFAKEEVNFYQWKDEKIINLYTPRFEEKTRKIFLSFEQMFDIKSYQVDINFNPKESYLSGKAKVEIESNVKYLDGLKFKFNPALDILRINDQERRKLFYTRDKLRKILYIYFLNPPPMNSTSTIEIFYRGKIVPPKQTADVIGGSQFSENLIYIPSKYESHLFSQSAYWYPSPPDEDYFKARLKIIVPPEYTCISNGELIEQTRLNGVDKVEEIDKMGSSVYVFETKYPLKYLSFIVGKFDKIQEDLSSLPIQIFLSSDLSYQKRDLLKEAKDILQYYESKFGPYPFEKLSIVQRIWSSRGGHSPASFIVLNELSRIPGKRHIAKVGSPVDLSRWKEYFIAHEIAHQWWGQCLTWKTYHDQWLSEGLAQFSAILYLKKKYGERVFSFILKKLSRWTEKKSEWGAITMGSRLSYFDFQAYQSIVYNKTSLVLNMLRDYLGEGLFFRGIKEFFTRYKYGSASTNDFIETIEEVSGSNLTVFSENWFDSYILPEVKVARFIQKKGEKYYLKFKIRQLKEIFVFPLWIEWSENGVKIVKKLIIDERREEFDFEVKNRPNKIKINLNDAVPGKFY